MVDVGATLRRLLKLLKKDESFGCVEAAKSASEPDLTDRLLVGAARLLNSVESRIDDIEDDLFYRLLRQQLPGIIEPMPAMMTMLLDVDIEQSMMANAVSLGSVISSRKKNKITTVKTMRDVQVYPMRLKTHYYDSRINKNIECQFFLNDLTDINQFSMQSLSLLIDAPYPSACVWYNILLNHINKVYVIWHVDGKEKKTRFPIKIKPAEIFNKNNNNLAAELKDLYRHISCPAGSLVVEVFGFDNIKWPRGLSSWSLSFEFSDVKIKTHDVAAPDFKINLVPVMHVQAVCADPIVLRKEQVVYPLNIVELSDQCVLYSLDSVCSTGLHDGEKMHYQKNSALSVDGDVPNFSFINNTLYPTKQGSVFLQKVQDNSILSIEASVVPLGCEEALVDMSDWLVEDFPYVVPKVFGPVSLAKPRLLNQKQGARDDLLALGFCSLLEKETLFALLFSINNSDSGFCQYIFAIEKIFHKVDREFVSQALFDVFEITVEVSPKYFDNSSVAYVFSCFLHQLYQAFSPINTFVRLKVKYLESPVQINWTIETSVAREW